MDHLSHIYMQDRDYGRWYHNLHHHLGISRDAVDGFIRDLNNKRRSRSNEIDRYIDFVNEQLGRVTADSVRRQYKRDKKDEEA